MATDAVEFLAVDIFNLQSLEKMGMIWVAEMDDLDQKRRIYRFPFMVLGLVALLSALWGGLIRLGWGFLPLHSAPILFHGPLFVSGFLGTLIGLERAVALNRRWAYAAPLGSGLGALALILGAPPVFGEALMALSSGVFVLVCVAIVKIQRTVSIGVMAVGAVLWLIGNLLWLLGWPVYQVVFLWMAFLTLTIGGERLLLSRIQQVTKNSERWFEWIVGIFFLSILWGTIGSGSAFFAVGGSLIALALWLLRHDMARRTVWQQGLGGFIALCLLSGYFWLGLCGVLVVFYGGAVAGPLYDAILHSFFLGFVFSMIFGHAPVIFPSVIGISIPFRKAFYIHLGLLHLSLMVRIVGDLTGIGIVRQWGGLANGVALILFFLNTLISAKRGRKGCPHREPSSSKKEGDFLIH